MKAVCALSHEEDQVRRRRVVAGENKRGLCRIKLCKTGPDNVVSFVREKCYDFLIRITAPRTIPSVIAGFRTGYAAREMFEHESPNESIFAWCERAKLVALGSKTDWISVQFDPRGPLALAMDSKRYA